MGGAEAGRRLPPQLEAPPSVLLDRVDDLLNRASDGGRQATPGGSKQDTDHDHGEHERVLDEGLALLALDAADEGADPSVETIHVDASLSVDWQGTGLPSHLCPDW